MSASAATSIGMGKASATPTVSENATSGAEAAPVGGATAAAGAEAAAEEKAETGSTEEPEVRKFPPPQPITTAQGTKCRSLEILASSTVH